MKLLWYIVRGDIREAGSAAVIHSREDAQGLCRCGWSVTLLASGNDRITQAGGLREVVFKRLRLPLADYFYFSFKVFQYHLRSREKPDFVFFRGPSNLVLLALWCKLLRIPFGQELNGVCSYRYGEKRTTSFLDVISDWFFARNSNVLVSVTDELNRLAQAEAGPRTVLAVAPNGVNTDQIRPCETRVRDGRFELKIGYLGKCYQHRGHELLINAISLLQRRDGRQVGIKLVGGGPNVPSLAEQAEQLGVAKLVEFHPEVTPDMMSQATADCDVLWAFFGDWHRFSLTGMSPLKVWTYLALGKPFILRDPSNVLVQFKGVPGVLWTQAASPEGIAELVTTLIGTNRDHLRQFGLEGRRYVETNGTWRLHAERIDAAIQRYFRGGIARRTASHGRQGAYGPSAAAPGRKC